MKAKIYPLLPYVTAYLIIRNYSARTRSERNIPQINFTYSFVLKFGQLQAGYRA